MNLQQSAQIGNLAQPERFFLNVPLAVSAHPDLTRYKAAKLVYGCLKEHSGSKDRCRLLWSTIAQETDTSRRTVARSLAKLEELGLIQRLVQIKNNWQTSSIYVLLPLECREDTTPCPRDTPPCHEGTQNIRTKRTTLTYMDKSPPPRPKPCMNVEKEKPNGWRESDLGKKLVGDIKDLGYHLNRANNQRLDRYVDAVGIESLRILVEKTKTLGLNNPGGFLNRQLTDLKPWEPRDVETQVLSDPRLTAAAKAAQRTRELRGIEPTTPQEPATDPKPCSEPVETTEPQETPTQTLHELAPSVTELINYEPQRRREQEPEGIAPIPPDKLAMIRRRQGVAA